MIQLLLAGTAHSLGAVLVHVAEALGQQERSNDGDQPIAQSVEPLGGEGAADGVIEGGQPPPVPQEAGRPRAGLRLLRTAAAARSGFDPEVMAL